MFTTEKRRFYRQKLTQPQVQQLKPPQMLIRFEAQTSHASTMRDASRTEKLASRETKQQSKYIPPESKMYTQSIYKKDYTVEDMAQWPAKEPLAEGRGPSIRIPKGEMECTTIENKDYISYDQTSADACRAKPVTHLVGTLTVLGQYKGKSKIKNPLRKPSQTDGTMVKKNPDNLHPDRQLEAKPGTAAGCSPKKWEYRTEVKPNRSFMESLDEVTDAETTHRTDYIRHDKTKRAQPSDRSTEVHIKTSKETFSGKSEYKMDYLPHEVHPRSELRCQQIRFYEKPPITIEGDTTYKKDFEHPGNFAPEKGKGHKTTLTTVNEPMSTVTTHRTVYLPHLGQQFGRCFKPVETFVLPDTSFADETTTSHDYKGNSGRKPSPIRNVGNLRPDARPMDFTTVTNLHFTSGKFYHSGKSLN